MTLQSMLYNTPLYQPVTLPPRQSNVIILCSNDDIKRISEVFYDYNVKLIICDKSPEEKILLDNNTIHIDSDVTKIFNYSYCYLVIFSCVQNKRLLKHFWYQLLQLKIYFFHIYMPIDRQSLSLRFSPDFYDENRDELEKVYSMLSDDESRMVFGGKTKSIITGDIGYIKTNGYAQYFHPNAMPQSGNIILDGGVSEYVYPELIFSKLVGDEGHIYGFEPEQNGCLVAENTFKNLDVGNITLVQEGLWNKPETVHFKAQGPGSRVAELDGISSGNTIQCNMTMIDKFVSEYSIKRVDIIKLDVERSEMNALLGGLKTIEKFRPKLLVSVYHKVNDIFELPLFIDTLCLSYKFYMGHHSPMQLETVLYAVPDENI